MSCGQIALNRAGLKYKNYYASEIDKYAVKVAMENYPNTIQLGDVTKWKDWDLPKIDLLIGGSPCQGFSFAGGKPSFSDPRSKLFFTFSDILKYYKPKFFIYENVRTKNEYIDIISKELGYSPVWIDSSCVSAQRRLRLYYTNIGKQEIKTLYGHDYIDILPYPEDKKIKLNDILLPVVDEKYYFSEKLKKYLLSKDRIKKQFVSLNGDKSLPLMSYYANSKNGTMICINANGLIDDEKASQITARYYKGAENYGSNPFIMDKTFKIRKLTPIECERLQTVPDNYTNHVSDTQRYKMLGNGWTVDVIVHILKFMENKK